MNNYENFRETTIFAIVLLVVVIRDFYRKDVGFATWLCLGGALIGEFLSICNLVHPVK